MIFVVIFIVVSWGRITQLGPSDRDELSPFPWLVWVEVDQGFPEGPGLWPFVGSSFWQAALPLGWGPCPQGAAVGAGAFLCHCSLGNLGQSPALSEDQAMCLALLGRGRYGRHTEGDLDVELWQQVPRLQGPHLGWALGESWSQTAVSQTSGLSPSSS